jgi:Fe-S-cluster containining protein
MKLGRPGEAAVLADMLIPLGTSTYGDGEKSFLYTCRHHDTETGDCRIYETRPMMCSEYPYGNECAIEGCTAENKGVDPLTQIRLKADWRNLKPDRGGA